MPDDPDSATGALVEAVSHCDVEEAANLLRQETGADAARVLCELNPLVAQRVLAEMEDDSRDAVIASASPDQAKQWLSNRAHPEDSIGWLWNQRAAAKGSSS